MDTVFALSYWASVLVFIGALIAAAISDFCTLKIPNWCPVSIAVVYLPIAHNLNMTCSEILAHYGTGVTLYLLGLALVSRGMIGGGDVKLLSTTCIWTGPNMLAELLISTAILGGMLALVIICMRKTLSERLNGWKPLWLNPPEGTSIGIPYGVAIAVAGLLLVSQITILI